LKILGHRNLIDQKELGNFFLMCQQKKTGGVMKYPFADEADPLHTLHSIQGLAKMGISWMDLKFKE
jgi:prenyltransferase beta subunit